ncbi:MAG: flagellar hook-basal body complex protein [Rhodospirillaceae bacterium]
MGVGQAFNTALGGLNAFASQVGYISDNLANVSTPGFKRVDADFQSFVTLSTQNFHSPGGVNIQPAYRVSLAGQVNNTDNPTAFSIANGTGFAPCAVPNNVVGGVANFTNATQHFTKACNFTVDTSGYLTNTAGQYLMGMKEQTTYKGDVPGTPSLGNLVGVRVDPTIYKSIPGKASTTIQYNANFPAGMSPLPLGDANATSAQVTSQVQFFDSLGNARTMEVVMQKIPVSKALDNSANGTNAPSQWELLSAKVKGVPDYKNGTADLVVDVSDSNGDTLIDSTDKSLFFTSAGALFGRSALTAAQTAAAAAVGVAGAGAVGGGFAGVTAATAASVAGYVTTAAASLTTSAGDVTTNAVADATAIQTAAQTYVATLANAATAASVTAAATAVVNAAAAAATAATTATNAATNVAAAPPTATISDVVAAADSLGSANTTYQTALKTLASLTASDAGTTAAIVTGMTNAALAVTDNDKAVTDAGVANAADKAATAANAAAAATNPPVAATVSAAATTSGNVLPQLHFSIPWNNSVNVGTAAAPVPSTVGSAPETDPQALVLNYGSQASGVNAATGSTQYAGTNLEVRSVNDNTGQAPGSFRKASIDTAGNVVFSYSNGQQLKPYRIPLITFNNPNDLERVTGAVFSGNDTLAGPPVAHWSGEGDTGTIITNSVEQSNVDIADELTKMIVAQRAYSSNGKIITTADEMIQETLGLKR